jgi:hypothetical protein
MHTKGVSLRMDMSKDVLTSNQTTLIKLGQVPRIAAPPPIGRRTLHKCAPSPTLKSGDLQCPHASSLNKQHDHNSGTEKPCERHTRASHPHVRDGVGVAAVPLKMLCHTHDTSEHWNQAPIVHPLSTQPLLRPQRKRRVHLRTLA